MHQFNTLYLATNKRYPNGKACTWNGSTYVLPNGELIQLPKSTVITRHPIQVMWAGQVLLPGATYNLIDGLGEQLCTLDFHGDLSNIGFQSHEEDEGTEWFDMGELDHTAQLILVHEESSQGTFPLTSESPTGRLNKGQPEPQNIARATPTVRIYELIDEIGLDELQRVVNQARMTQWKGQQLNPSSHYWLDGIEEPTLVYFYFNADLGEFGLGFNIADGGAFLPMSDLNTNSTLVPMAAVSTLEVAADSPLTSLRNLIGLTEGHNCPDRINFHDCLRHEVAIDDSHKAFVMMTRDTRDLLLK